jgi:hypothetical protein
MFFVKIMKKFWLVIFFVVGVKPGRCLSMREDGKAVKLEFWAVEKERENLQPSTSLPVLNRLLPPALLISGKAQDEEQPVPMDRNTTSMELLNRNRKKERIGTL